QRQRQVVDAEEAQVLERAQDGALAGPREPGHEHDAHHSTSSEMYSRGLASAMARLRRSWNSFAEWWPWILSSWLRAATSMIDVVGRPGRTGIFSLGRSTSRTDSVISSTPSRSYSSSSLHSTSSMTSSIFLVSRTAAMPNRSLMLMMPRPR